jgi:hypothetical protein
MNVERGKIEKFQFQSDGSRSGPSGESFLFPKENGERHGGFLFYHTKLTFIAVRDGHESDLGSTLEPRTPAVSVLSRLNVHN